LKDISVYEVEYCAYSQLRRSVVHEKKSFTAGEFEVLTHNGQSGISYCSANPMATGAMYDEK
jgi:hypothetical protein